MIGWLTLATLLAQPDGGVDHVRLQAAIVIASTSGEDVVKVLQPLEARLKTLLPYNSYKGFTEYTASVEVGEPLNLRLPDGRVAHLTPGAAKVSGLRHSRAMHVAIDHGAEFDSRNTCDAVTLFQVKTGSADNPGDRTFLVFEETCPGDRPPRMLPQ